MLFTIKVTVIQLYLSCTLLVIASQTNSVSIKAGLTSGLFQSCFIPCLHSLKRFMDIAIKNIYKENVDLNQSWKFNIDTRQKTILNQGVFKYANKEKLLLYITSRCRRGGG